MRKILFSAIVTFSGILSLQAQTPKDETLKIPPGCAVKIDGKIEENEWRDAAAYELTGGGKVFIKHDGEYLLVGVRGATKGWSHLYFSEGDDRSMTVMHASAALGKTVYSPDKSNLWQPSNTFNWELRDRTITAETEKKMAEYLARNSWAANNVNMTATPEIEFRVKPRNLSGQTLYIALVHTDDAKKPRFFPATLKDDTIREELVYGNTPNDLKFDRQGWAKIILEDKKIKTDKK